MKKITLIALMLFTALGYAQVGINTNNPDASSALEIESTTGGILIPRLTETQRDDISAPATGLMIYQTDQTAGFYFYDGNVWTKVDGVAGPAGVDGVDGADGVDGLPGANGTDGVDGAPGLPGADGTDGVDGAPGLPGADGTDGVDGAPGLPGADGTDGAPGLTGAAGTNGTNGTDGAQGLQGPAGPTGDCGLDGNSSVWELSGTANPGLFDLNGPTTTFGAITQVKINYTDAFMVNMGIWLVDAQPGDHVTIRERCVSGNYGIYELVSIGITGIPTQRAWNLNFLSGTNTLALTLTTEYIIGYTQIGPSGPQGPTGVDGIDGTQGDTGAAGPQGEIGVAGPQGDTGVAGPQGEFGVNGAQGPIGLTGSTGPAGADGTDGVDGNNITNVTIDINGNLIIEINNSMQINAGNVVGAQGLTGAAGIDGTNGSDGQDGAQGATGFAGPAGDQGVAGPQGPAGLDGANGINGIDGQDGTNGNDGVAGATGPAGPAGADGTSYTQPTYNIGDVVNGGVVFYLFVPGDIGYVAGESHGLVVAFSDVATYVEWGCFGADLPNVPNVPYNGGNPLGLGAEIGDGFNNTNNILKDCPTAPAALAARSYGPDWFLPSAKELNQIYINKTSLEGVSGFTGFSDYNWSSTESGNFTAWEQYFGNGQQYGNGKGGTTNVRAVRAF